MAEDALTAASPNSRWFSPTGPFFLWRDGGSGTLALMMRAYGDTGTGVPTGDVLSAAGSYPGETGYRGTVEFRLVLTGTGPVNWGVLSA